MTKTIIPIVFAATLLLAIFSAIIVTATIINPSTSPPPPSASNSHLPTHTPYQTPTTTPTPTNPPITPTPTPPNEPELTITTVKIGTFLFNLYDKGSDKVVVALGGGSISGIGIGGVVCYEEPRLINDELLQYFDVVTVKGNVSYYGFFTTFSMLHDKLFDMGYKKLYFLGISGGGIIVLNELVKPNTTWNAAVVVDAPCNGAMDSKGVWYYNELFCTLPKVSQMHTPTCFVSDQDEYRENLQTFYNQDPAYKIWCEFSGPHYTAISNVKFWNTVTSFFREL